MPVLCLFLPLVMRAVSLAWRGAGRGLACLLSVGWAAAAVAGRSADEGRTTDFTFVSQGLTLSGLMTQPAAGDAKALVVFVHGYGPTDVRGSNMYAELRTRFAALGIASLTWDKPGQGQSEGTFDINQPVTSSAQEVVDAIAYVRKNQTPGCGKIVLWGISRAGWIAPLVLSRDPELRWWISVSGVTAEDNYLYLLQSNLPYEGSTVAEAQALMAEWRRGFAIFRDGGAYEDYRAATKNLWANAYIRRMAGDGYSREDYQREQAKLRHAAAPLPLELETGMTLYVHDFEALLSRLHVDTLALFGEKDLNVDWRKTRACYEATIARNPQASLNVRTFPDGNHNIDVCENGSMREMQAMRRRQKSEGYLDAQLDWLRTHVLLEPARARSR